MMGDGQAAADGSCVTGSFRDYSFSLNWKKTLDNWLSWSRTTPRNSHPPPSTVSFPFPAVSAAQQCPDWDEGLLFFSLPTFGKAVAGSEQLPDKITISPFPVVSLPLIRTRTENGEAEEGAGKSPVNLVPLRGYSTPVAAVDPTEKGLEKTQL